MVRRENPHHSDTRPGVSDKDFFGDAQWTPEQLAKMDQRRQAKDALENWMGEQMDRMIFNRIIGMPEATESEPERLYTDTSGGFQFAPHSWKTILKQHERHRYYKDALAHRDEAIRRRVVCRMEGRITEADHWLAAQRFFENNFKIPPHE
jgi:hypothetical protein